MTLRIWGRKNSSNVQKVLWCCAELGLDFERIDAGLAFGRVDDPDYRALNPNGLVPTIEDGDFSLWESNAILRYLGGRHGRLIPADLQQRARMDQWLDWQQVSLTPALLPAFFNLVRMPADQRDPEAIGKSATDTATRMTILDRQLAEQDFVCGKAFSLADIALGIWVYRWYQLPVEKPALSALTAWRDRLATRPGFHKHIMHPLT